MPTQRTATTTTRPRPVAATLANRIQLAERFVEEKLYPVEREVLADFTGSQRLLERLRDEARDLGLWAPQMPRSLGGGGLSFVEHAGLVEVLAKSPIGLYVFGCQAPDAGNMEVLLKFGTDQQRRRWLEPLVAGELRSCFAMTEPDRSGSNPTWLDTAAERQGAHYILNGHKWFTTAADGAEFAIVMAVTAPEEAPHRRASLLIVPMDSEGVEHVRRIPVMGEEGAGWNSHSELRFLNVKVPAANLLGEPGAGFSIAQARLGPGRIHHCMRFLAIAARALDLMCRRAVSREIAPGVALGTRQAVQHMIADSRAELDAARLYVHHTAAKLDREGAKAAQVEISAIKFLTANMMHRVLDRAIQMHGALGMSDETPLAWFYRHERAGRIFDGADEVHRSSVARQMLKPYGLDIGSGAQ